MILPTSYQKRVYDATEGGGREKRMGGSKWETNKDGRLQKEYY